MAIGFYGGLRVEEYFPTSLKGMLKFWEDTRFKKGQQHLMVTIKGWFKG